jgi:hypothetical protein
MRDDAEVVEGFDNCCQVLFQVFSGTGDTDTAEGVGGVKPHALEKMMEGEFLLGDGRDT